MKDNDVEILSGYVPKVCFKICVVFIHMACGL